MIQSAPRPEFVRFINSHTQVPAQQVADELTEHASEADGVAERGLKDYMHLSSRIAMTPIEYLQAHPDRAKTLPTSEEYAAMDQPRRQLNALPREVGKLGDHILRPLLESLENRKLKAVPTHIAATEDGMLAVTLSRMAESPDDVPISDVIGAPLARVFIDITPGAAGVQVWTEALGPPPRPEFVQFINGHTQVSPNRVTAELTEHASEADGVAEQGLQGFMEAMSRAVMTPVEYLRAHPERADAKPTDEENAAIEAPQRELESLPKEVGKLGGDVLRPVFERLDKAGVKVMPTDITAAPGGMFAVTLSRMTETWDKNPEPLMIGEPRARMFVDTTPGVAGVQVWTEDLSPRPRAEFLQLAAAGSGKLPQAVVNGTKMHNASAGHPVKEHIRQNLEAVSQMMALMGGNDELPEDEATKTAAKPIEERLDGLRENDKLQDAYHDLWKPLSEGDYQHMQIGPTSVVDHGDGLYSIPIQAKPYDFGGTKKHTPVQAGTFYLDLRPGLPGYSTYFHEIPKKAE